MARVLRQVGHRWRYFGDDADHERRGCSDCLDMELLISRWCRNEKRNKGGSICCEETGCTYWRPFAPIPPEPLTRWAKVKRWFKRGNNGD